MSGLGIATLNLRRGWTNRANEFHSSSARSGCSIFNYCRERIVLKTLNRCPTYQQIPPFQLFCLRLRPSAISANDNMIILPGPSHISILYIHHLQPYTSNIIILANFSTGKYFWTKQNSYKYSNKNADRSFTIGLGCSGPIIWSYENDRLKKLQYV